MTLGTIYATDMIVLKQNLIHLCFESQVFNSVAATPALSEAGMVLFYNKKDLLEERLKTKQGREAFKSHFASFDESSHDHIDAANLIKVHSTALCCC